MQVTHFHHMILVFSTLIATLSATNASASSQWIHWPAAANFSQGTIVIHARERKLYLVMGSDQAIQYKVAVPKSGKEWSGTTSISGKYLRPAWTPPNEVRRDHPELPSLIPGGSPHNPMGYAAMTLERNEIAIHGTTQKMRESIGSAASYGCIRMLNEDIADLYDRVGVGTPVVME